MPQITFEDPEGGQHIVDVPVGMSLMQAATYNGIPGILGECGGGLACATCHVFLQPDFLKRMPEPSSNEEQMLDLTATPRKPESRLSCQIIVASDMNGMVVRIADKQV